MIPKLIHQTWIGSRIPKNCVSYVESIKNHFKDWEYKLWTDSECEKLLEAYYPKIYEKYLKCPNNGEKADLFRYCILHMYGGFYFDLDYECFKSFEYINGFENYELFLFYETEHMFNVFGSKGIISNSVIGTQKNSYFFEKIIKYIESNMFYKMAQGTTGNSLCKVDSTLFRTGPFLLTKIFATHKKKILIDKCFLGSSNEFTYYNQKPNAYGIHHCMHTWFKDYA